MAEPHQCSRRPRCSALYEAPGPCSPFASGDEGEHTGGGSAAARSVKTAGGPSPAPSRHGGFPLLSRQPGGALRGRAAVATPGSKPRLFVLLKYKRPEKDPFPGRAAPHPLPGEFRSAGPPSAGRTPPKPGGAPAVLPRPAELLGAPRQWGSTPRPLRPAPERLRAAGPPALCPPSLRRDAAGAAAPRPAGP